MKHWPVLFVALSLCILPGRVAGQVNGGLFGAAEAKPGVGAYALEGLGAVGTGAAFALPPLVVTTILHWDVGMGGGSPTRVRVWSCVTVAAYAVGTGFGAGWVGRSIGWYGSPGWSYGLAMVPAVVGAGGFCFNYPDHLDAARNWCIVLIAAAPILSTVGYNIVGASGWYGHGAGRLSPPSFAARMTSSHEAGASVCFDARILCVRF